MGLCPGISELRQSRARAANLAASIQLASTTQQSKIKTAHQQTRPHRGQPVEAPQLERRDELNEAERDLIRQLPARLREFEAGQELVSEHSEPSESCLL